jgi:DNA-binding response OmpR family regulator
MPPHVLIVDDSELVTGALRLLLEESGFRVSVAADLAEAEAACLREAPDVALLDLSLPDGDGLALLGRLPDTARPRVSIALTGHDDPATRQRCLDAGCRDVLVKPVPIRELVGKVRGWAE